MLFDQIDTNPKVDAGRGRCMQCPITLDLMTDLVIVCTGQTYDREARHDSVDKAGCSDEHRMRIYGVRKTI